VTLRVGHAVVLRHGRTVTRRRPWERVTDTGHVAEQWTSTPAGAHLSGRRSSSTVPEVLLRQALHRAGARFRLHPRLAKGCTPDVVLPRRRLAVFVDGCFWHNCPVHGRKTPFTGPNADLWAAKLRRNRERDAAATAAAGALGWTVVRVWECDVRGDPDAAARAVLGAENRPAGASGCAQD
jgi:DNA mismatch endonuclease (patch repair protein)